MMAAGIVGGYLGPLGARQLPPKVIRGLVIAVGAVMTGYFFHIAPK